MSYDIYDHFETANKIINKSKKDKHKLELFLTEFKTWSEYRRVQFISILNSANAKVEDLSDLDSIISLINHNFDDGSGVTVVITDGNKAMIHSNNLDEGWEIKLKRRINDSSN